MKSVRRISCCAFLMAVLSLVPFFPSLDGVAFGKIGNPIPPSVGFIGFSEENFGGEARLFSLDPAQAWTMWENNNWVSSVIIPENVRVTFFEKHRFKGKKFKKLGGEVADFAGHGIRSYKIWHLPVFGDTPETVDTGLPIGGGDRVIQVPITDVDSFPRDLVLEVFDEMGNISDAFRLVRDGGKFYLAFIPGASIEKGEDYRLTMKITDQLKLSAEREIMVHTLNAPRTTATVHQIDWSPSAANLPRVIRVKKSDILQFNFRAGDFTNLYLLESEAQLNLCTGNSPSCFSDKLVYWLGTSAVFRDTHIKVHIKQTSTFLNGPSFEPGGRYFFTSFADGSNQSVTNESTRGGECLDGLYLIVEVEAETE